MLGIERIHHVSLPVADLERSKQFYSNVLGLQEITRPPFDFPGAWYQLGDEQANQQLHLIVHSHATFRAGKGVDSRDVHFAVRVTSYRAARLSLRSKGFTPDAEDELRRIKENPQGTAGWPQLYIIDPDRNVIEFSAASLDEGVVSERLQEADGPAGIDHALLQRLRTGDPRAESELMLRFARPIREMMLARIADRDSAEDASQEAFLALLLALRAGRLRDETRLQAYAYGITRNIVRRHYRTRMQTPVHDPLPDNLAVTTDIDAAYEAYEAHLRAELDRLGDTDAEILRLAFSGYTSSEIGRQLNLRPEAVRTRKRRAVAKIMERLRRRGAPR